MATTHSTDSSLQSGSLNELERNADKLPSRSRAMNGRPAVKLPNPSTTRDHPHVQAPSVRTRNSWYHLRLRRFQESSPSQSINIAQTARQALICDCFERGFSFSRKLTKHSSCVNALAFSREDGRWLASGGDDCQILLWDFHQEDIQQPSASFSGPQSNVFCVAFSASRQHIYSGGTDAVILRYDLERASAVLTPPWSGSAVNRYPEHDDSIRGLSCHPAHDDLFLSGSEDGKILMHDIRAPPSRQYPRAQGTVQCSQEITGVEFHPTMHHLFATCDVRGGVHLRDARMAFGPLGARSRQGVVLQYTTTVSRTGIYASSQLASPEPSSISFDRDGSRLAVQMMAFYPTIYAINEPMPLATLSGRYNPDGTEVPAGQRTYANYCTIKNGSFGGAGLDKESFYAAGSDDFRGYVWKLPDNETLRALQEEVAYDTWKSLGEYDPVFGFARGSKSSRYLPVELSRPLFRLNGHKSIVNTVQIHPTLPYIATAGIERHILLHSPTSASACAVDLTCTNPRVRQLPRSPSLADRRRTFRAMWSDLDIALPSSFSIPEEPAEGRDGGEDGEDDQTEEDATSIALFDTILRDEGQADVMVSRPVAIEDEDDDDPFYMC